ncbi:hypothetical protein ACOMHN_025542 [Nucella lapillus]
MATGHVGISHVTVPTLTTSTLVMGAGRISSSSHVSQPTSASHVTKGGRQGCPPELSESRDAVPGREV